MQFMQGPGQPPMYLEMMLSAEPAKSAPGPVPARPSPMNHNMSQALPKQPLSPGSYLSGDLTFVRNLAFVLVVDIQVLKMDFAELDVSLPMFRNIFFNQNITTPQDTDT